MAYLDTSCIRRNIHIIRNVHIPVKEYAPLLGNIDRDAFLGRNVIRNMDISVPAVEGDTSAGNQCAVIPDDEVPVIRSLFINVLAGCHRNVAGFRDRLAQNINGSKIGFNGNILFRRYRFIFLHVIGADVDITLARLHCYAFIPGLDRLGNDDVALAGNSCNDVPGSCNDIAFQRDISIPLHFEAGFVPRRKRSFTCSRAALRFHIIRRSADIDTASFVHGNGFPDLNIDVIARLEVSAHVINRFPDRQHDIVSGCHASANAGERSVRTADHNIMRRVGVPQQIHIPVGCKDKIAFGAVSAKDFYFIICIIRTENQNT